MNVAFQQNEQLLTPLGNRALQNIAVVPNASGVEVYCMLIKDRSTLKFDGQEVPILNVDFITAKGQTNRNLGAYDVENKRILLNAKVHTFNSSREEFDTSAPEALPNEFASWLYRETLEITEETNVEKSKIELFSDYLTTFLLPAADSAEFLIGRAGAANAGTNPLSYNLIEHALDLALRNDPIFIEEIEKGSVSARIRKREPKVTEAFLAFQNNFRVEAEKHLNHTLLERTRAAIENAQS